MPFLNVIISCFYQKKFFFYSELSAIYIKKEVMYTSSGKKCSKPEVIPKTKFIHNFPYRIVL